MDAAALSESLKYSSNILRKDTGLYETPKDLLSKVFRDQRKGEKRSARGFAKPERLELPMKTVDV